MQLFSAMNVINGGKFISHGSIVDVMNVFNQRMNCRDYTGPCVTHCNSTPLCSFTYGK